MKIKSSKSSLNGTESCIAIAFGIILAILILDFWSWLFMLLWNAVVSGIFHGPHLTHFQAFLVWMLLAFIGGLFKSSSK